MSTNYVLMCLAAVVLGGAVNLACGTAKGTEGALPHSMTCQEMTFDGTSGRRCENAEATCYFTRDFEAMSCMAKGATK